MNIIVDNVNPIIINIIIDINIAPISLLESTIIDFVNYELYELYELDELYELFSFTGWLVVQMNWFVVFSANLHYLQPFGQT